MRVQKKHDGRRSVGSDGHGQSRTVAGRVVLYISGDALHQLVVAAIF